MRDCPYYLYANRVQGADPDGRCSYGCRDAPQCLDFGPMTADEVIDAAHRLAGEDRP